MKPINGGLELLRLREQAGRLPFSFLWIWDRRTGGTRRFTAESRYPGHLKLTHAAVWTP